MKQKNFVARKRFLPALIAFVCHYWNRPDILYTVQLPPYPSKGTTDGHQS